MNEEQPSNASEQEEEGRYEKRVQKRRSLVFQRRSNIHHEHKGDEDKPEKESEEDANAGDVEEVEEAFDLQEYVSNLRKERRLWIETWRERKAERKMLTSRKLRLEARGQPLDLTCLSERERSFVRARPNYEEIRDKRKELFDVAVKVAALTHLTRKLNKRFITQMEERLYDVTKRIIKISES